MYPAGSRPISASPVAFNLDKGILASNAMASNSDWLYRSDPEFLQGRLQALKRNEQKLISKSAELEGHIQYL
jgi:hypothetical protein